MVDIYQGLCDKWWLIYISRFVLQVMAYIYQDLYEKWSLIYIKFYMRSDGLYIWIFIWQVMA